MTIDRGVTMLDELRPAFAGELVGPGDEGYESARRVWNHMIDRRPAVIARCTGTKDVVAALRFARERDLPIAVRGGGHNVAGNAMCDDGVVIDLSGRKGIRVDPGSRTARVEPGVLLGEFDRATQEFGLATPTGVVSQTGLAGLTLGGGLGWIGRKHGTTCDNLLSAEVVTADGAAVRAAEDENPELLWGLRGGGGNFGVVTSFEYRLHPVGPQVLAGAVFHPFSRAADMLRFFADFVQDAPEELTVTAAIARAKPGTPVPAEHIGELIAVLELCWIGDLDEGDRVLLPLRTFGPPLSDLVGPMPFTAFQSGSDGSYPPGQYNYWKSHLVDELTDEAIDAAVEHARGMTSPLSLFYFQHLGGAISRAGADTAAFGHRHGSYDFNILTVWRDPAENDTHVAWARGLAAAMEPFASGVYVNNLGVEGADRVKAAYMPETYERLVALKDRYDPANVFRLNQNIRPSGG